MLGTGGAVERDVGEPGFSKSGDDRLGRKLPHLQGRPRPAVEHKIRKFLLEAVAGRILQDVAAVDFGHLIAKQIRKMLDRRRRFVRDGKDDDAPRLEQLSQSREAQRHRRRNVLEHVR